MRSSKALAAAAVVATAVAGCGGDGGKDPEDRPERPAGIISDRFARAIPLDTPREAFLQQAKVQPVKTTTERQPAADSPVKGIDPKLRRELERKFGKARNGVVRIPAREFECLHYRGEQPKEYSRKFCFWKGRLEFAVTAPPLPADL